MRWNGRFSKDDSSWTPKLKKELGYTEVFENRKDNGLFWMLMEDALTEFKSLEMNWNPALLHYSSTRYGQWKS